MKYFLILISCIFIWNEGLAQCSVTKTIQLPDTDRKVIALSEDVVVSDDEYTILFSPYYHENGRMDIYVQLVSEPICIKKEDTYIKIITEDDSVIRIRHMGANNCRSDIITLLSMDYVSYLAEKEVEYLSISNRGFNRTVELNPRHSKRLLKYFSCLVKEYPIANGLDASKLKVDNVIELERGGNVWQGNKKDIFESNISGVLAVSFAVCEDTMEASFILDAINWQCSYPNDSIFFVFEDGIVLGRRNSKRDVDCEDGFLYKGLDPFLISYLSEVRLDKILFKSGHKKVAFNISKANSAYIIAYAENVIY